MEKFILGFVFCLVLLPILEGLSSLILSFFEMIKSYFARVITKNNQKIQQYSADSPIRILGFTDGEEVENNDI